MRKKVCRFVLTSVLVVVFLLCLYYVLAGHLIPFRYYNKMLGRFDRYTTETIECDDHFTGSIRRGRLEMSKEDYLKLREELIVDGWHRHEDEDWREHVSSSFSEEELEGESDWLSCKVRPNVLGKVLETVIGVNFYVIYDGEKVLIEYHSFMSIHHRPFEETR